MSAIAAYANPRSRDYLQEFGSFAPYQLGRRTGNYKMMLGEYTEHIYNRGKNWFVERPYKGLGALGAIFGGIAGLFAGPIGVLIGGAIGSAVSAGAGAGYYWAWGRGKRIEKDNEFLKGRSFGKWTLDNIKSIQNEAGEIEI